MCLMPPGGAQARKRNTVNMMNTMNVNSARRPRRLPGTRTARSRAQSAVPVSRGLPKGRSLPRGRCLDGRGKQLGRPVPGLQDQKLAAIAAERGKA
jgi:hypothetical protein